jgi:putative acetyltransferase
MDGLAIRPPFTITETLVTNLVLRPETSADHEAIRRVNRLAFGQEDEARLVDELRAGGFARLSLVAERYREVIGHILFSDLPIRTSTEVVPALALAPMAVLPEHQRHGVGSALVRRGLELCREQGHRIVVVLGHPDYYPRFGFSSERALPLEAPFPREAFMRGQGGIPAAVRHSGLEEAEEEHSTRRHGEHGGTQRRELNLNSVFPSHCIFSLCSSVLSVSPC